MRITLGLVIAAAVALGGLCGCDDQDNADLNAGPGKHRDGPGAGRPGIGRHAPSDGHPSIWKIFGPSQAGNPPPPESGSIESITLALRERMLPSRDSIRILEVVEAVTQLATPAAPGDAQAAPTIVLSTTPWNDDTMLLWVDIPGRIAGSGAPISIEFDPRSVAGFRPLGDPARLRLPEGEAGRAAMLYELAAKPDDHPRPDRRFATLHIGAALAGGQERLDRPITAADFVPSIDDAPDIVRAAAAAAGFAQLLRGDPAVRDLSCHDVISLEESANLPDPSGRQARLIELMRRAEPLIDLPPTDAPPPPPDAPPQ